MVGAPELRHNASAANPAEAVSPGEIRRYSLLNVSNWRRRLDPEDIRRIRIGVEDARSYGPKEW